MANFLVCSALFRVVMPLILLTCVVFRPCILSGIYLLFTLVSASVPVPTPETMNGATGIYLKILIMLSTLTGLGQLIFQCLLLLKYTPYGEILNSCGFLERLLRHAGFVRLDQLDVQNILVWVTPEVVMFLASIAFFITFKKLVMPIESHSEEEGVPQREETQVKNGKSNFFLAMGKYLTILAFCVAAIFKPSVIGGFYFLVFLSSATWWSCNKQLAKCFGVVLKICMAVVICHIFTLYTYQTQWPQEFLDPNSTYARYFGLSVMLKVNCDEPRNFIYEETIWTDYANVVALLLLYFIIAMESKQLLQAQPAKKQGTFSRLEGSFKGPLSRQLSQRLSDRRLRRSGTSKNRWQSATRKVRLLHRAGAGQKYGRGKGTILQDSTGSVIVNNEDAMDDIPMENIENGNGVADDEPSIFEQTVYILESILLFVIRTSYIATNIIMMAWSITYHSWLTFVLLLWANILWMVPNQRKFMLRSSPFLVLYAWFLLISAYIYSMNLTDEELPVIIYNIDLAQIGFQKIRIMACTPLFIKCLFTTMFWITLKQYVKEREDARNISVLADMTAPLQISVGAVTDESTKKKDKEILTRFGNVVRGILTRFWIWIVAITLFFVAITGERMTSFRILYMALFLTFILSFQVSFRAWRKIMFAFWITVIVYSMLILVLVYTYQFNHFADYWRDYLHVSEEQQLDIGLEKYDAKQLFVRLVTPTFFVIITVIQVHYFHKDFLELSKPNYGNIMDTTKSEANSSAQGGIKMMDDDDEENEDGQYSNLDLTDIENVSVKVVQKKFYKFLTFLYEIWNLCLLFLEIHMPKFVLLMAMVVCLMDTCALYLIVIVFIVLGASVGKSMLNISIYWSSFIVSILMLLRMVYQIKYIDHDIWNVNCTVNDKNLSMNDAEWLGFRKVPNGRDLPEMVKWNIVFIIIVTLWCVLKVRQINFRAMGGDFLGRPFFMFPHIKVGDSHRNLKTYLKYLANYFYYRLGVEISLIGIVATIGFRMDMYALMYAIWLCILFSLNRTTMAKVWNVFLIFIAFVISIQYIMVIGLPPSLCISFPWDSSEFLRRLQEWAYLMSATTPPPAKKIMCDFILLLLVSRQALVFRIERRYGDDYTGGSNDSIVHNAEDQNFTIPIPDFVTYSRTYLDILKKAVFLPFMWITLAIVFLAGTNRVNLFSIGYLLGSFYFLWQGSDIYLRQIPRIIQKWNVLISYNVAVITVKALLQLIGCIFIEYLEADCCWLIQLLGISCVRKFKIPGTNGAFDGNDCTVPPEYIGLAWDGACFACLVFQKRLFQSYSFFHIINDNKASAILATRGAELIEELRQKRMVEQEEEEKKIIEKIKMKMDKIKANQQKILGPNYQDSENHYVDSIFPKSNRPMYRRKEPKHYKAAIRSGDYYMFDDLDNEELDLIEDNVPIDEDDDEIKARRRSKKFTLGELLSATLKTDVGTAIRLEGGGVGVGGAKRRVSLPPQKRDTVDSQFSAPLSAPPAVHVKDEDDEDEPQPSTSRETQKDAESKKSNVHKYQKILDYVLFVFAFIESFMLSAITYLNKYTKDYRYVLKVLSREKKILKESTEYNVGIRLSPNYIWQPASTHKALLMKSEMPDTLSSSIKKTADSDESDTKPIGTSPLPYSAERDSKSTGNEIYEYDTGEMSSYDQPTILRLILAVWYIILSHSDLFCYFIIFLNQIKNATFMSLPLPLMVFFWGTLTVPRPSKTFWVTIIAYTQIIVVIKCVFQFDILPWTSKDYSSNINSASLIGIERKKDYAVWDLLLLLVVYFHRYMLKCLGLWKTTFVSIAALADGEYSVEDGELVPTSSDQTLQHSVSKRKESDLEQLVDDSETEERVELRSIELSPQEMWPASLPMVYYSRMTKYVDSMKHFFQQLFDPGSRVATDVYSYMFLCDFFNFFVILIGYSSFGTQQGDGGVSSYIEDNRVPVLFLLMLILQFLIIIVDRAIFLRKNIFAKIVFQFLQILILHIWLFVIFPVITERKINLVIPPQMYYMVKCFYLLLSAYQIRSGYPSRILGNFLCKGYNYANMFLFKGFMLIPFLFELRTVMDWMWTDTSMTVFDFIKMEDIFAHIFQLKCTRHIESEYPQPRGEKKKPLIKYFMGGGLLVIIIGIIWFPLVFFSLGNAVGEPNPPYDVTVDLKLGPYESLYRMTAQTNNIYKFKENDFHVFQQLFTKHKGAQTFLSNYEYSDLAAVKLSGDSATVWSISPPDHDRLVEEVESNNTLTVHLTYHISHKSNSKEDPGIMRDEIKLEIPAFEDNKTNPIRQNLLNMLKKNKSEPVLLTYIMPKFVKVTSRATVQVLNQFMLKVQDEKDTKLRNITLMLESDPNSDKVWWNILEQVDDQNYKHILQNLPYADKNSFIIYTFNDKIFPSTLSIITGGGIIGLYTTLVFVASRLLRGFFSEICFKIMFDDMPYVDRVLQLCLDIYLVREAREFCLEEDLFAKLVFLYRSPETLIKWTRPKEELDDEDDPEGDDNQ
ncbi:PREDICTED: piezo-type mechanosensitive ion channel component isoform X3 [Nicrophorus vespilloides]|uniref:Piezo-type mechanosensitive ion channel component isoform X3 n=1 Tax=Nicrophorus vespilloides TaxID=110193 RepID=A0ABM1M258_NICVS|nr:PREDICTED: piezo-type mechanosensitive ion channel component isoform X3 [Nicrophorus vespilloides]